MKFWPFDEKDEDWLRIYPGGGMYWVDDKLIYDEYLPGNNSWLVQDYDAKGKPPCPMFRWWDDIAFFLDNIGTA